MGSGGVSGHFPENEGGRDSPLPLFAYTKIFQKVFPYYLAIGMTYDQFWNQDVALVKAYREADRIKKDLRNQELWLQGAYIYEAILDASPILRFSMAKQAPKPIPYPDHPYELRPGKKKAGEKSSVQEERERKNDQKAKAMMEMFMVAINKKFEKKGGGENG